MPTRNINPSLVLIACGAIVALSTPLTLLVQGYGTVLMQVVVLCAWGIVAKVFSQVYADLHRTVVMVVALFLITAVVAIAAFCETLSDWLKSKNAKS